MSAPNGVAHIWRPKVEPTDAHLPYPNQTANQHQQVNTNHVTKTSLKLTDADRSADEWALARQRREALNDEILRVSQSFNNSPKPFLRQTAVGEQRATNLSAARSNTVTGGPPPRDQPKMAASQQQQQQKLVHNMYNSPLDLYSMNNIRKTIEAHSEQIAPGVKGINFSKLDNANINKQSEVYKLVMEEERQSRQSAGDSLGRQRVSSASSSCPSSSQCPTQQQPLKRPSAIANSLTTSRPVQYASEHNHHVESAAINTSRPEPANEQQPKCCECGLFIVGPFAKLNNRFIHSHCFNCATCGTSLKNSGYFTINEKLYCEIHAKQVANLMRLNYNFDANSQQTTAANERLVNIDHHQAPNREADLANRPNARPTADQPPQALHASSQFIAQDKQQATISTMFSNRLQQQHQAKDVQHWKWGQQATTDNSSQSFVSSQTMRKVAAEDATTSYQKRAATLDNSRQNTSPLVKQHQIRFNEDVRQQQHHSTTVRSLDRIPVCCKCSQSISGPYVLAGSRTLCKSCSQRSFVCLSCKRSLLNVGFVELEQSSVGQQQARSADNYCCEPCFNLHYAFNCSRCQQKINGGYCLNALGKHWHPECFVCGHCKQTFGNSLFYLEDNVPYCQRDWNLLFTSKCYECSQPIGAGDKWIEALDRNYHLDCFRCSSCQVKLEGSTFYCKNGKPICRLHAK